MKKPASLRDSVFLVLLAVALLSAVLHSTYIHQSFQTGAENSPHVHHLRESLKQSKEQHRELERQFAHERMGALHGLHESRAHHEVLDPHHPDPIPAEGMDLNMKDGEAIPPALYLRSQAQIFDSFDQLPTQPPRMHAIINEDRAKALDKSKNAEWNKRLSKFVSMGGGMKTRDCVHKCLDLPTCKQAECIRPVASQSLCDECIFEFYEASMVKTVDDLKKEELEAEKAAADLLKTGYVKHKGSAICGLSCATANVNCHKDVKKDPKKCRELCDKSKKCQMFQDDAPGFGICITFDFGTTGGHVDGDVKHVEFCAGPTYVKA